MNHTKEQAIEIAKEYKKKHSNLENKIANAVFNEQFDVQGRKAWIVTGHFNLFGEIRDFYYVVSDQSGKVEYTFNEHGTRNPHIETEEERQQKKIWDKID